MFVSVIWTLVAGYMMQHTKNGKFTSLGQLLILVQSIFKQPMFNKSSSVNIDLSSIGQMQWNCPIKNVSYIKLHRVGSGTMHNMLVKFAIAREAFVAIADCIDYQVFPQQVAENMLFPPPQHPNFTGYNMFIDHAVFNRTRTDTFLPADVVYISQIRHPYPHSFSVYDSWNKWTKYQSPRSYETFLHNPSKYEKLVTPHNSCPNNKTISISRNFMALEFGYPKQTENNKTDFLAFLSDLDAQLYHVSILERLQESLVLLRRKLCWHSKDILRVMLSYHQTGSGSLAERHDDSLSALHKDWDSLDYILYDYFLRRHEREVAEQDKTFKDEVKQVIQDQESFSAFCATICERVSDIHDKYDVQRIQNVLALNFTFHTTQFYEAYNVSYQDCVFLQLTERNAKRSMFFHMNPTACTKNRALATKLQLNCNTWQHVIPGLTVDDIRFMFSVNQCRKYFSTKH